MDRPAAASILPPGGVLAIKLGALGDVVQALGPLAAIARHHADRPRVLLTTAPYVAFLGASGWYDAVWVDARPGALDPGGWLTLRRRLRAGRFARVYDLQTSDRSGLYFRLFWPGPYPEWSGIARGCSHPHVNPDRDRLHTLERQAEQLAQAGIASVPPPDLGWMTADLSRFALPAAYALLAPGGAPHRPGKRWPVGAFAELARRLASRGIAPVLAGTAAEAPLLAAIADGIPSARALPGQTTLLELGALARGARAAAGNDNGAMHLAAAAGAPSVVLFGPASDPALCAPRGANVRVLRADPLASLPVDAVWAALAETAPQSVAPAP